MEITLISKETIKPSSATPHHLKHWKLSLIDQCLISASNVRVILFYSAQGDGNRYHNKNMSDRLKRSLSDVLTDFYPIAGRLNDNRSILCDDGGLEYTEACVKAPLTLDQFLTCPKAEELQWFLPNDETDVKGLSAVRVTLFDACGGMAIGVSIAHVVADASSTTSFVNAWASLARGVDKRMASETCVNAPFNFASLFPSRDVPLQMVDPNPDTQCTGKLVTKRFIFPQSEIINRLKVKFEYQRPTRVETISALIFKCLINASKSKSSKPIFPGMAINLRRRMHPPMSTPYLGNMALLLMMKQIVTEASLNDLGTEISQLIKEVDGDYVKSLQANNAMLLLERLVQHTKLCMNKDIRPFALSSWCRFPFYEVDFGWGEPTWAAPVFLKAKDSAILMDAKNGDGVEAWITLEQDDMRHLESELDISQNCFNLLQ